MDENKIVAGERYGDGEGSVRLVVELLENGRLSYQIISQPTPPAGRKMGGRRMLGGVYECKVQTFAKWARYLMKL